MSGRPSAATRKTARRGAATRRRTAPDAGAAVPHARSPSAVPAGAPEAARYAAIDALRAIAILMMVAYHFAFDLAHFGLLRADPYRDPAWLATRTLILSTFLALAGVSLWFAASRADFPRAFWRRLAMVAGCALLVTAGSFLMFPRTYIYFGVLHAIAVSLLVARPFLAAPSAAAVAGVVVVALGVLVAHPAFDFRGLNWIGFAATKPATEDYVPLFPWMGIVLLGVAAGRALDARRPLLAAVGRPVPRWLAAPGRHSLLIYMVHQPILLAIIDLFIVG